MPVGRAIVGDLTVLMGIVTRDLRFSLGRCPGGYVIIAEEGKHMDELLRKRRKTSMMTREPLLLAHSTSQRKETCCGRPEDLKCKAKFVDDDSSSDEAFEPVPKKKKKNTSFQTRVF